MNVQMCMQRFRKRAIALGLSAELIRAAGFGACVEAAHVGVLASQPRSHLPGSASHFGLNPLRPFAKGHCGRSSRSKFNLSRLTTRETPSTTPGHTNGTVTMVRGRSRFLEDTRHTNCGKRKKGMAEGWCNCVPPLSVSQICCRSMLQ